MVPDSWLVADDTGRIAQAAAIAPGAFAFAHGLARRGDQHALAVLQDGIREGRKLNQVIGDLADRWMRVTGRQFRWTATMKPAECGRLRQMQCFLVRRAGPGVSSSLLVCPPPAHVVPEYLPRRGQVPRRWYRIMKGQPSFLLGAPRLAPRSLVLFASKNLNLVAAAAKRCGVGSSMVVAQLALAAQESDLGDSRVTRAIRQVLENLATFGGYLHEFGAFDRCLAMLPGLTIWRDGNGVLVRPIRAPLGLCVEGASMGNCVESYLPKALDGGAFFAHAEIDGKAFTIMFDDQRRVVEVRSRNNIPAAPDEILRLGPWMAAADLRYDPDAGLSDPAPF